MCTAYLTCPAKIKIYMYSSPFSTLVFSVLPADRSKCTRPLSTLVFPCDASRSAVFADRIVSRPPRAADPRTATARPDLSLSAAAVRAALSLLYLSTLALSRDSTCLSLSICARFFTPSKRNLSSSSRPSRRSSSDNHESQNHTYCTGTPHVNTHRSPPSIQRAFCPSRSAISTSSSRARAHRRTTNQFRGGGQ